MDEDTDLISRLKAGEEAAFKSLFDLYKSMVYNTALGFLPNKSDAEDITQEVFIQVFRSISQFKEESKLSTWIYRITITKCLDQIRKRKAKKRFAFFTDIFHKDENSDEMFINYDHPGIEAEKNEMAVILFKTIEKLPDNQRIAFILSKVEKKSSKEIAKVMEITVSSVESLIFRAKGNLKKRLEGYYSS
ncbi:RNA polymerase sigma factor [soil metagenome]